MLNPKSHNSGLQQVYMILWALHGLCFQAPAGWIVPYAFSPALLWAAVQQVNAQERVTCWFQKTFDLLGPVHWNKCPEEQLLATIFVFALKAQETVPQHSRGSFISLMITWRSPRENRWDLTVVIWGASTGISAFFTSCNKKIQYYCFNWHQSSTLEKSFNLKQSQKVHFYRLTLPSN